MTIMSHSLGDDGIQRTEAQIKELVETTIRAGEGELVGKNYALFVKKEFTRRRNIVITTVVDRMYSFIKVHVSGCGLVASDVLCWNNDALNIWEVQQGPPQMLFKHFFLKTFDVIISRADQSYDARYFWVAKARSSRRYGAHSAVILESGTIIRNDDEINSLWQLPAGDIYGPAPGRMRFLVSNKEIDFDRLDMDTLFPSSP